MSEEKTALHPRNKHRSRYDFSVLVKSSPELRDFIVLTPYGDESVDFSNPLSVKTLNKALLKLDYGIQYWDIPEGYLCPPIPGRADYVHYLADLLASVNGGVLPRGEGVKVLDIGVGANCVYPIIGHQEYGWTFVGSEADIKAVAAANNIIAANAALKGSVEIRLQPKRMHLFKDVIRRGEVFELSMCNPPFHSSAAEAAAGSQRKLKNLGDRRKENVLNFGGQPIELWCEGGEVSFIYKMIQESVVYADQCKWFTTLVSKSANLPMVYRALEKAGVPIVKTVEMAQGQKTSRFVAWSFNT